MSSLQWSSTRQGTCWPRGIKVAEWSSSRERPRSVYTVKPIITIPFYESAWISNLFLPLLALDSPKGRPRRQGRRGTPGSTTSTARSRAMSRTLTTWRVWRLRRRSTRSDGCRSRTRHISSSPPMVRHLSTFNITHSSSLHQGYWALCFAVTFSSHSSKVIGLTFVGTVVTPPCHWETHWFISMLYPQRGHMLHEVVCFLKVRCSATLKKTDLVNHLKPGKKLKLQKEKSVMFPSQCLCDVCNNYCYRSLN